MVEHTWTHSFFLLSWLQFTGASFFIRLGDTVSLPCNYLIPDQSGCNSTTWIQGRTSPAVELINLGQTRQNTSASNRLSVGENCCLVIKQVKGEDAGRYTCRQFDKAGKQQGNDSQAELSVVHITEHEDADTVTLNCFVWTQDPCKLTVSWLPEARDVAQNNLGCNATATVSSSYYVMWKTLFTCRVSERDNVQLFAISRQHSRPDLRWLFILAALVLVALLILAIIGWKRTKGNASRMNKDGTIPRPAGTHPAPEASHRTPNAEDSVFYISINFNLTTQRDLQVGTKNGDDKGKSVTYSTVKASLADPCSLYASIK